MDVYIYFLQSEGVPFYVGQTINPKQRSRNYRYAELYPGQLKLKNKLAKIARENNVWEMVIVETATEHTASERERWHIANLRNNDIQLCNVTDGGETPGKWSMSDENKEKIRNNRLAKNGGEWHSDETKAKIGMAHKGKTMSPEARAKMSAAWKRTPEQLKTRAEKASNTSRGRINIKQYVLTDPNGKEHLTTNGLSEFCRMNHLTAANLSQVLSGKRTHHKGWGIRKA